MTPAMRAAVISGVAGLAAALAAAPLPRTKSGWILLTLFVLFWAWTGAGLVRGYMLARRIRHAPAIALVLLAVLSPLVLWPEYDEWKEARAFLPKADSTMGVISGHSEVRGPQALVTFSADGIPRRASSPRDPSYRVRKVGDSLWVYYERANPDHSYVGRPGPNIAAGARRLAWFWALGGVLLMGYILPSYAWAPKSER